MGRRSLVVMVWCALVLAGCELTPVYETRYSFTPPKSQEGRTCAAQCLMHQQTCSSECSSGYQACKDREEDVAQREYHRYLKEQHRLKKPVKLGIINFRRGDCSSKYCHDECGSFYRECFQLCGGQVSARQVCTAFCDRKGGRS